MIDIVINAIVVVSFIFMCSFLFFMLRDILFRIFGGKSEDPWRNDYPDHSSDPEDDAGKQ